MKYNAERLHNEADFGHIRGCSSKMHGIRYSFAYFFKDIIVLYNLYEFPENGDITSMRKLKKTVVFPFNPIIN